ncbi:MAG: VWA domain-containing protein [Pyrinomonadaceae bacterium]
MKKFTAAVFIVVLFVTPVSLQTPQKPEQQIAPEDIVRITTNLVQTDVVVTDKNDKVIPDLKLDDFELYDNGKRQTLSLMEYVGIDTGRRREADRPAGLPLDADISRNLTAKDLKRVVAFVVDDLTIPYEDMATVRQLLTDFVNNQMRDGDLVAIVRVIGGKGLLQQFTSDRQLLRRAIAALNVQSSPYSAFNNPAPDRQNIPIPARAADAENGTSSDERFDDLSLTNPNDPNDETLRLIRGLTALSTADYVIDSLREVPGRKNLFLISGGIPIFEGINTRSAPVAGSSYSNVSYLFHQLEDNAVRSGVVINTLDPRGLKASPGVVGFNMTPARSALGAEDPNFGRGGSSAGRADLPGGTDDDPFGALLSGASEHLGLDTVSKATGGVSVVNTNNFKGGIEKALSLSDGYYLLAYRPSEKFDRKFHTIQIKVKRDGAKVYAHRGYVAREESTGKAPRSKEEEIILTAKSPLAKNDIDVSANVVIKPALANDKTPLAIHLLIDANKLTFTQTADGKYQTSFDVVGFVHDQFGKLRGGFSETINTNLSVEDYRQALAMGLTYSASTELPSGYFQVRAAVREAASGNLGTVSKYVEIPNLSKGHLAMSSIFLFAVNVEDNKATPAPLLALRAISRKRALRYATLIYNPKSKTPLRSEMIISQAGRVLYREPEQSIEVGSGSPITKVGELGLSKVPPGRYVLTWIITDPGADKKWQTVMRSIDFTVTN